MRCRKVVESGVDMLQLVLILHERLLPFTGNTTGLLLQLCLSCITSFNIGRCHWSCSVLFEDPVNVKYYEASEDEPVELYIEAPYCQWLLRDVFLPYICTFRQTLRC